MSSIAHNPNSQLHGILRLAGGSRLPPIAHSPNQLHGIFNWWGAADYHLILSDRTGISKACKEQVYFAIACAFGFEQIYFLSTITNTHGAAACQVFKHGHLRSLLLMQRGLIDPTGV